MAKRDERQILYSFWKELPLLAIIEVSTKEIYSNEARVLTIRLLKEGIEDSVKGEKIRRFALNARELVDLVNKEIDTEMSIHTFYFHLQKLQKAGIIYPVTTIHEGRHNVAYFGRTAKNFFFEDRKQEEEKYRKMIAETGKLARILNPDLSKNSFEDYIEEVVEINHERYRKVQDWLSNHEKDVSREDLDLTQILSFLSRLGTAKNRLNEIYRKIAELVDFEIE